MTEQLPGMESERRKPELSQWYTPPALANRIVAWAGEIWANRSLHVLEPSAGRGALVRCLVAAGHRVTAVDVDEDNVDCLIRDWKADGVVVERADFLAIGGGSSLIGTHHIAVMNPPFEDGGAEAHVLHALTFAPRVVAHVPLTTLEGKKRREGLWSEAYLKRLAICSSRPKYGATGGATAMCTIDVVRRPEGQPKNGRVAASGVEIEWWA